MDEGLGSHSSPEDSEMVMGAGEGKVSDTGRGGSDGERE
jgi:hypothetical protein